MTNESLIMDKTPCGLNPAQLPAWVTREKQRRLFSAEGIVAFSYQLTRLALIVKEQEEPLPHAYPGEEALKKDLDTLQSLHEDLWELLFITECGSERLRHSLDHPPAC